ncbi:hypothetical protein OIU84_027638 [Salix udensis]|uniref:GDSL esterase/lipase n=1 Tax=Salix udensis TaxID=889485 RepID=A0AAD6KFR9_9ROSI|nr:hypothetical protein OIU84_027638 [Salix udensis]
MAAGSATMAAISILIGLVVAMAIASAPLAEARAFFVFGDSLVDNGNNNYLILSVKILARNPPCLISVPELTGQRLLVGANFASAGIGILNDTGIQFLNIIRMYKQLEYFEQYQRRVTALIGAQNTQQLVNEALILITVGGNDFVNNYYLVPFSARSRQFRLPDYVRYLISEYRKLSNGPMGCVPAELAQRSPDGQCSAEIQRAAALYNPQLTQMIGELNNQYGADIFIAANTRQMATDFVRNPQAYGFITSKIACCGQGPYNGLGLCTVASNLCPNRDVYAFWDPFHPSERANGIITQQILTGDTTYMYPMNLSTILALDSRT